MELTNSNIKMIRSLATAKGRRGEGLFKVEGAKAVADTLGAFGLRALIATRQWEAPPGVPVTLASPSQMERISAMQSAPEVVAIYELPVADAPFDLAAAAADGLVLALDTIQDPGNLGTIIRTADWFGIRDIVASHATADAFGPKVVQATMGALGRVRVHYCDLPGALSQLPAATPVCGTFIGTQNIYTARLPRHGVIVIGNEGQGISPEVQLAVNMRLTIPPYGSGKSAESLNAAVATAITVAEFRRQASFTD